MDDIPPLPIKEYFYNHEYYSYIGSLCKKNKNYDSMKKYFILSHKLGNKHAISKLGLYYHTIEKNYDHAIKCYSIGEKNNSIMALQNLCSYYNSIGNTKLALEYNAKVKNNPDYSIVIDKKNKILKSFQS
jgi:hypothetical protein